MLKLKYLFNNVNLAEMILGNWEFDQESMEELFRYYRISSNAIYPFRFHDRVQLLRFAPVSEKNKHNILAELEFIAYLRNNGYGVLESVKSKKGEELAETDTPWGEFYATVFKRVSGVQLNKTEFEDDIVFCYGQALGQLHRLSRTYTPIKHKRWSHTDVLDWVQKVLNDFPHEKAAIRETKLLRDYFESVPITASNYGLIHYDFECDNVFYDEGTKSCNVIDFDDAMYHWYVMDIEQALESLRDDIPVEIFEHKKRIFMDGYRMECQISEDELSSMLLACRRFSGIYGYARILRSQAEQWANEPEWLVGLRRKLVENMRDKSSSFGMELNDY